MSSLGPGGMRASLRALWQQGSRGSFACVSVFEGGDHMLGCLHNALPRHLVQPVVCGLLHISGCHQWCLPIQ